MKISIVIPNYNGEALLKKNLPKVLEAVQTYSDGEVEIIVVDDASADASASVISNLKSQISNLKFIRNEKNLGFSSTVNRGVKEASGEVLILLNTDVAPEKEFLEPLVRHFEDPKVFAVGCMDKSVEKGKVVLRGRGVGKFERGFLVHWRGEVDKTDTLWVSGGSGAFRKSIWDRLGGFDPLYNPFYYEDIDLSYRALKSMYKILFEPKSVVVHEHEHGAIQKHYSNSKIRKIAYRNQFIFVWKNITDFEKQFFHALWLPYHIVAAFFRGDFDSLVGFFWALLKFPSVAMSSFKAQKSFVKSDKEILG